MGSIVVARGVRAHVAACLLAVLALLAAGCQARLAIEVTVDGDGAGSLTVGLAADAALRAEARSRGVDPLDELARVGERLEGSGWLASDTLVPGGGREVRLTAAFSDPAEFNLIAADLATALAAPEAVLLEGLRLDVGAEEVRLDGAAALVPGAGIADLGLDPEQVLDRLRAEQPFAYEIVVTMPGEVLETSATAVSENRLRWSVEPGERVRLLAVSERPRIERWVLAASGAAGGLAALLLGLVVTRRRRRPRARS
jgi:hypothetical protein